MVRFKTYGNRLGMACASVALDSQSFLFLAAIVAASVCSVVRFKTQYGNRLGIASAWLDLLAQPFVNKGSAPTEPSRLPIFLRRCAMYIYTYLLGGAGSIILRRCALC